MREYLNIHKTMYIKVCIKTVFFLFILCFFSTISCAGNTDEHVVAKKTSKNDSSKSGDKNSDEKKEEPPKIANFMLRGSQQPGSFISFGQNIIDKNQWIYSVSGLVIRGPHTRNDVYTPYIIYGISDKLSVNVSLPIVAQSRHFEDRSSGFGDLAIALEYAFYSKSNRCYYDQATIVTNFTFPSGSADKNPETGFGAPSFFVGGTFSHAYPRWFIFTSDGVLLTSEHDHKKMGNQYLYQAGVGRNLFNVGKEWIVAAIAEVDGQFTEKTNVRGVNQPDSGGNVVYVTPSLWVSSKNWIFQFGVGFPAEQHLFGHQAESQYLIAANVSWTC